MMTIDHKTDRAPKTYRVGDLDLVLIGSHSYANKGLNVDWWGGPARLRVGNYCSFAEGVQFFLSHGHRTDWIASYPFANADDFWLRGRRIEDGVVARREGIVVGSDVWIGNGARILSGVVVGDGAVIGTGAVVTRDVPPFTFVAGNPARVVRPRFPPDLAAAVQRLAWWNWPEDKVRQYVVELCSPDIGRLVRLAEDDPDLAPFIGRGDASPS